MLHGVSANGTLLSFYDYGKQTRISPSTYLLTVSERPVLLRRDCGILEDEAYLDRISQAMIETLSGKISLSIHTDGLT